MLLSLVAVVESLVVGHVAFTRLWIENVQGATPVVALAPLAVLPAYQRRGIGTELVAHGLGLLRCDGERSVFVLGEPDYYKRFGFSVSKAKSIETPFPPEAFMALELIPGALDYVVGKARYARSFSLVN